jgi:hypothetical protein
MPTSVPILMLLMAACTLSGAEPAGWSRANDALEALRDDQHRARIRVVWGDAPPVAAPTDLDIVVLRGYLNRDLLRLRWREGRITADVARVDRTWFYHSKPGSISLHRIPMAPDTANLLWSGISHLLAARAETIAPAAEPEAAHSFHSSSSHAPHHLFTWSNGVNWTSLPVVRGMRLRDGIRDFDDLRVEALSRLAWGFAPEHIWTADDKQESAPRWRALWRDLLPRAQGDGSTAISERDRLLAEDACMMLGDLGEEVDAALLTAFATGLRPALPRGDGEVVPATCHEDEVRAGIARATERIALRHHWDAAAAIRSIHRPGLGTFADEDQKTWLRARFHRLDPAGYRALLLADLQSAEAGLVVRSVTDLARHHPGEQRAELRPLLDHQDPAVVFAGAMALLGKRLANHRAPQRRELADLARIAEQDPLVVDALTALTRLAGDPGVPIPPALQWSGGNARTSAIAVLSVCPPPWTWDRERMRHQLDDPREDDGRLVADLLNRLGFPFSTSGGERWAALDAADRAHLIATWRRCLGDDLTRGTLHAIEELSALGDRASLPRMRELLARLRAGCNSRLAWQDDPAARFPWTDRYQLNELERRMTALGQPEPARR